MLPNQTLKDPNGTTFQFERTPGRAEYRIEVMAHNGAAVHFLSEQMATELAFGLLRRNAIKV